MGRIDGPKKVWLKPKVLFGFIVIIVFAITAISITYKGFIQLSKTKQELSQPKQKLILLNTALTDIYEAESNIRAYNLTHDENYLNTYFKFLLKISDRVDTLLILTKDNQNQNLKIETIKQLLEKKGAVLDEFIELKKTDKTSVFYDRALEEIAKVQSVTSTNPPIVSRSVTTITTKRDTVLERAAKKSGFFGRIKKWIAGKEKYDTTLTKVKVETHFDTIARAGYIPDSLVVKVMGLLHQIRTEQQNVRDLTRLKELELLKSDKALMDQIRVIVSLLEREELAFAYKRSSNAEEVVRKSTLIVLALGGAAFIMILLFIIAIFRDISKSNFYRNELFEAKKYAEMLLKVKEQFLANMSHEIRTPLSSMIGLTRQLKKTELNSKQDTQVKLLASSSEHLLNVINDILDFSKIEAGQMRIESLPFNPAEVIQETILTLNHKAEEKGLTIEKIELNSLNSCLWGDPFRLKQITLNLLSNAIKFTDKGSISIISDYNEVLNDLIRFDLTVKDTGIGISDELQSQIFEEFSQADPSVTRKYGGTGLGLTIVKRLTEIQGGEIKIESKPSIGTSITISIPYKTKGEYIEKRIEISENLKFEKPFNVLVIDDDDVNRLITEELLKNIGTKVHSTGNPTEALDLIVNNSFDIIFTDIQMPEISGYDIVQSLTKSGITIPVIAMTANSMFDNPNRFTESGFAGYLIKPFAEADLVQIIKPFAEFTEIQARQTEQKNIIEKDYDLSDIYRFAGGDKESAKLILSTFIDNTDINLTELNRLIDDKNTKGASAIAHKMKPTFRQFKIHEIASLLQEIEEIEDNADNLDEVKSLIERIIIQVEPIIKALKKELEQM